MTIYSKFVYKVSGNLRTLSHAPGKVFSCEALLSLSFTHQSSEERPEDF